MSKKIYLTFVGQLREYSNAIFSHVDFVNRLYNAVNFDPSVRVDIYVSIITWSESYNCFPKHVNSFVKNVDEEYIQAIIGEKLSPFVAATTITVVSKFEERQVLLDSGITNAVDDFHSVAYLHEKSFDAMLEYERCGNFKFDTIILTRPDLYLKVSSIDGGAINATSASVVYYKNAFAPAVRDTLTPVVKKSVKSSYEQYVDQFNIFGRTAFCAYGLMFRYIIACKGSTQFFYSPSLHFWVDRYLEKFRISKADLVGIDLKYAILRPTYIMTHPTLDFSNGNPDDIIKALEEIEECWQRDIDNHAVYHFWLHKFSVAKIPFNERLT